MSNFRIANTLKNLNKKTNLKQKVLTATCTQHRHPLSSSVAINESSQQHRGEFPLPSDRAKDNVPGQGWHTATTVKASRIPGAGYGRFSDVDVPKNTIVMTKPLIPMAEVSSIHSIADDEVLLFKNKEEIERFISLYEVEGQQGREDTVDCLAHFIWTLPTINGVTLNFSTWSMNHGNPGKGENIRFFEEDGSILGETVTDVKAGDELLNDYRDFDHMDEFWVQFCKDEGVKDVMTNLRQFVDL